MDRQPNRFFRFTLILLLAGIFLELAILIGLLVEGEYPDGNIAVVEVKGQIDNSHPTVRSLKEFAEKKEVKAIVLRIDSPGGSVGASQEIHDQVLRTKKEKPVVVSMGDVAASGGYYAAAPASKIVANPGTITGSIGVIAHHLIVGDLLKRWHLRWEVIQSGKMKNLGSPLRKLKPEERRILQTMTNDVHDQFIQAVAKGRKLKLEKVKNLADGRVFSGRQAKKEGLVDELGGLEHAIDLAAKLAKLPEDPKPIYPKEERFGWFQRIVEGKLELPSLKFEFR